MKKQIKRKTRIIKPAYINPKRCRHKNIVRTSFVENKFSCQDCGAEFIGNPKVTK